jgi:hypothetical protein
VLERKTNVSSKGKKMKKARIYVDFNELIDDDLVLLSKTDLKLDSNGLKIKLEEGMHVSIYEENEDDEGIIDNLIADGIVVKNTFGGWTSEAKWLCRIDEKGIHYESDLDD